MCLQNMELVVSNSFSLIDLEQKILRTNSINFQKDLRGTTSVICGREPEQSHFLKDDSRLPTNSETSFGANNASAGVKLSWVRVVALLESW